MAWTYRILHRPLRLRKVLYWLMLPELACMIAMLVFFGLEQPDLFRTKFWQIGYDNKLNSDPNMILYAYANHRPLPTIPFVWSQALTNFNVAISVLSLFVLLTKMIMFIMHVFYPLIATLAFLPMTIVYIVSLYGQAGPDYADSRYPSPVAWYIRLSCNIAKPSGLVGDCIMAKATFAVTFVMMFIYFVDLCLALWAMWPNKKLDEQNEDEVGSSSGGNDKTWEMQPQTPRMVPFTPRTQAFNQLQGRKFPA